jgi:hypothetical protein
MRFLHRLQRRRLTAGPAGVPARTVGRPARQPEGAGCRSRGSASPIGSRSGRRLANAGRSRVGTPGTPGGTGETPHEASGGKTPPGAARAVAVVSRRPLPASRLALTPSRDSGLGAPRLPRLSDSIGEIFYANPEALVGEEGCCRPFCPELSLMVVGDCTRVGLVPVDLQDERALLHHRSVQ